MDPTVFDGVDALRSLTAADREVIAGIGETLAAAPGEPITREGDPGSGLYLLLSGRVQVLRRGQAVAELEPGAILGEMALFNENVRTGECRALEACELFHIPADRLCALVLQEEPAAVRLMQALGQLMVRRVQEWDEQLLRRAKGEGGEAGGLDEVAALRRRLVSDWALKYHELGRNGKLVVLPSKPVGTAADLTVAYSPGVAEPCAAIRSDPWRVYDYTTRGQLVGVVTNGTAVLGLGNIGPLAAKPVMEGKAVLFKRFADLDSFDIEVDETDPRRFVDVVCALTPTFGGINLEDIRAPDCFLIETECQRRADIPIFHDDQHGTAIIAGAGLVNALDLVGKSIDSVRVVFSGAGAAGFACAKYFLQLGVRRERLVLTDVQGVVYRGRGDGNYLDELAAETDARTLSDALEGADVFVGVSAPNVLTPAMLQRMAANPIVFALANPVPEIDYPTAKRARPDVIMATGRSDYPNQINNVIAFPYIFRGALDTRARAINEPMKLAATRAIAALAREPITPEAGLGGCQLEFGRGYLIPKPFDRRLLTRVPVAVAEAAAWTEAARAPLDLDEYRQRLARLARTIGDGEATARG